MEIEYVDGHRIITHPSGHEDNDDINDLNIRKGQILSQIDRLKGAKDKLQLHIDATLASNPPP